MVFYLFFSKRIDIHKYDDDDIFSCIARFLLSMLIINGLFNFLTYKDEFDPWIKLI